MPTARPCAPNHGGAQGARPYDWGRGRAIRFPHIHRLPCGYVRGYPQGKTGKLPPACSMPVTGVLFLGPIDVGGGAILTFYFSTTLSTYPQDSLELSTSGITVGIWENPKKRSKIPIYGYLTPLLWTHAHIWGWQCYRIVMLKFYVGFNPVDNPQGDFLTLRYFGKCGKKRLGVLTPGRCIPVPGWAAPQPSRRATRCGLPAGSACR